MKHALPLLLLALATITACTDVVPRPPFPSQRPPAETASELFLKSFDQLAKSNESPALEALRASHPESVWTEKADALADLQRSRRRAQQRLDKVQSDLHSCRTDREHRQEQIDRLKNDLKKMKDLVIEMELRSQ